MEKIQEIPIDQQIQAILQDPFEVQELLQRGIWGFIPYPEAEGDVRQR